MSLKSPCERCGIACTAQYCGDCQAVDPAMCAGGRPARLQQKHLMARKRQQEDYEFVAWMMRYTRGPTEGRRRPRRDLSPAKQGPPKG